MSQPIKKDEIVESGVLDNLLNPLIQVQEELKKTDAMIVSFADAVSSKLNFGDKAKEMREFVQAEQDLTKVYEQKKEVQKEAIKNDNEIEKLKRKIAEVTKEEAKEVAALRAELQAQNKELRDSAKAAKDGTEAYKALEKEVTKAKNESKNLGAELLALKKAGQENTAEYQQLAQTYAESTARAAELDQEIKSLDKSVGDNQRNVGNYASALENLDAKMAEGNMTMREMSQLIKQYQTIAANAGMESPIGQQALAQAGQLKDRISDISAVTKALSTDTINLDAAKSAVTGLAGGYQAVQGAMVLVGAENQDMMKAMAKLTAIQSVMNGLKSFEAMINKNNIALLKQTTLFIKGQTAAKAAYTFVTKGATTATMALRAAMIALPIMAIVAGIALLVSKLMGAKKETEDLAEAQKKLKEETDKQNTAIAEQSSKFVGLIYQLKNTNAQSKERETLMKRINDEYGTTLQNLSDETAFQAQLNLAVEDYIKVQRTKFLLQKNQEKFVELLAKEAELQTWIARDTKTIADEAQRRGIDFGTASRNLSLTGKELDKNRQSLEQVNRQMEELGLSALNLNDEYDKLTDRGKKYEPVITKVSKATRENTKATRENNNALNERDEILREINEATDKYLESQKAAQIQEENAVRDKYFRLIELGKKYNFDIAILETARENELKAIRDKYREEEINAQFDARKKELEELNKQREIENLQAAKSKEEFDKWEKQRQIDHLEAMLELEKEFGQETIDTRLAIAKAKQDLQDKEEESLKDSYNTIAKSFEDIYIKAADKAIESMKRQEQAAANMYSVFAQLAAEGNITAQQSLAEMINRQEELQRRQEQMERRKLRMQRATQASSILVNELDKGKSVPEALAAMGAFLAASESLIPSFYEGTENTGKGGKIDAKGGFAAILHPNERVLTASQNSKIGDIPNPVVADVMYKFRTGQLDSAGTSYDLMRLADKLDNIEKAIQNQPRQVVGLEETLSGVVKLATSQVKGNHKVTNRFQS